MNTLGIIEIAECITNKITVLVVTILEIHFHSITTNSAILQSPNFQTQAKPSSFTLNKKTQKKKKGRIQRDKPKHYEAFQQTSSMPTQKTSFKNANNNSYC